MSLILPRQARGRRHPWAGEPFSGAKIACFLGSAVLCYQRDDKPDIPWPGFWDLPGGGRENGEDPIACALRELHEEFGLSLPAERVDTLTLYPGGGPGGTDSFFCCMEITPEDIAAVRFGDEGQRWAVKPVAAFISHPLGVPSLQARLRAHWAEHA